MVQRESIAVAVTSLVINQKGEVVERVESKIVW